ncbi:nucleoside hydrolase [Adhaeribacter aquaticus]|uniref:nucleoside hydrolase n=1 Tax=Adhaeribacter aquaticus TaxID=299567 RepID=UPI00047D953F|nr:nucleoside hydrolase [Adhaeribacter aquaticus]
MKLSILCLSIILCFTNQLVLAQTKTATNAAAKKKVIFDCDLGDDIDDAYALALLLASQEEIEILGITTAYGRTRDRAELACKMLYETGQEKIPVAVGRATDDPWGKPAPYSEQYYYAKGFNKVKPIKQNAVDFIIENLRKYPNQVTIITVGPVQNMQDVLKKDPGALKLAKDIYAMFGSFYIGYNGSPKIDKEWNVRVDIPASKAYTSAGVPIVYAGLDVTTFVKWDEARQKQILLRQSPLTNALVGLKTLWGYEKTPTLFDAVAVGMVLWPDLFTTKPAFMYVDDEGYTIVDAGKAPNSQIGVSIKTDEFLKRLMQVYMHQNLGR